jgi:ferritin-like metal-binding protein YciE
VGFDGLKKEHEELREQASSGLVDLIDLGAAARTECYEIAAYESLRRMAKAMGQERAVELLDENLKQEKDALREVEKIATRLTREHAATAAAR